MWFYPDKNNFNYVVADNAKYHVSAGRLAHWEGQAQSAGIFTSDINANGHDQPQWTNAGHIINTDSERPLTFPCSRADDYVYPASGDWRCQRLYACYEEDNI